MSWLSNYNTTKKFERSNLLLPAHMTRASMITSLKNYPDLTEIKRAYDLPQDSSPDKVLDTVLSRGRKDDYFGMLIDSDIEALIYDLNKAGFSTSYSCAGHGGKGYSSVGRISIITGHSPEKTKAIQRRLTAFLRSRVDTLFTTKMHSYMGNYGVDVVFKGIIKIK